MIVVAFIFFAMLVVAWLRAPTGKIEAEVLPAASGALQLGEASASV